MWEYPNDIIAGLSDARCGQAAIAKAERLLEVGCTEDLIRQAKRTIAAKGKNGNEHDKT